MKLVITTIWDSLFLKVCSRLPKGMFIEKLWMWPYLQKWSLQIYLNYGSQEEIILDEDGLLCPMLSFPGREKKGRKHTEAHRGECHAKKGAEIRGMELQTKDCQDCQATAEAPRWPWNELSTRASGELTWPKPWFLNSILQHCEWIHLLF